MYHWHVDRIEASRQDGPMRPAATAAADARMPLSRDTIGFGVAAVGLVVIAALAIVGQAPAWLGIIAGIGAVATGLAYVAAWSLDNIPS